jgi:hypothetical protein
MVKRRGARSRHVWIREMSANDPLMKHRKPQRRHPKPGLAPRPGTSMKGTYLLAMRGPVYRRHDSYPGFRTELENRVGDAKGKGTSGHPTRPKVPMHRSGAHCFVVARKRGNSRGAKGAGHPRRGGVNGETGGTPCLDGRRQPSLGGTSRMNREVHVRICGRLGAKFPGPTRRLPGPTLLRADIPLPGQIVRQKARDVN